MLERGGGGSSILLQMLSCPVRRVACGFAVCLSFTMESSLVFRLPHAALFA